jgi:hypothetical protein
MALNPLAELADQFEELAESLTIRPPVTATHAQGPTPHPRARHTARSVSAAANGRAAECRTKLWRARDKLVNIRGAGYWLRDTPLPAFGYEPDRDLDLERRTR